MHSENTCSESPPSEDRLRALQRLAAAKSTDEKEVVQEEWRKIPGVRPDIEASNLGRMRSLRYVPNGHAPKILSLCEHRDGYLMTCYIDLSTKKRINITAHRAVALAFIPNPDGKRTVNHINGIKSDNRASNLEWATQKEQCSHTARLLPQRFIGPRGERNRNARLKSTDIPVIRELLKTSTVAEVARQYRVAFNTIGSIYHGLSWKHIP